MSDLAAGLHAAAEAELGRRIAEDMHWMMQRFEAPPLSVDLIADTRYTRVLRVMAEALITALEKDTAE